MAVGLADDLFEFVALGAVDLVPPDLAAGLADDLFDFVALGVVALARPDLAIVTLFAGDGVAGGADSSRTMALGRRCLPLRRGDRSDGVGVAVSLRDDDSVQRFN